MNSPYFYSGGELFSELYEAAPAAVRAPKPHVRFHGQARLATAVTQAASTTLVLALAGALAAGSLVTLGESHGATPVLVASPTIPVAPPMAPDAVDAHQEPTFEELLAAVASGELEVPSTAAEHVRAALASAPIDREQLATEIARGIAAATRHA